MAEGILVGLGLTEAELLDYRDAALEAFASGGRSVASISLQSGAGTSRSQAYALMADMSPRAALREIKYALWKLDPTTYADCAPAKRVTYAKFRSY